MTFTLRRATPGDLPTILRLLEEAEMYTSSVTLTGEVTYLLGEWDGQPVAVLGMEHGEGATLLRSFTVKHEYRGRGLSLKMLEAAYAELRGRGDQETYLFSADEGGFWVHQGYDRIPAETLAQRLPEVPQVRSALTDGWLSEALAWTKKLAP